MKNYDGNPRSFAATVRIAVDEPDPHYFRIRERQERDAVCLAICGRRFCGRCEVKR